MKHISAFILLTLTLTAQRAQTENCEPGWASGTFCISEVSGSITVAMSWNDGTGEALYIGGDFTIAGCETEIRHIAKWDGSRWSPLVGPGGVGLNRGVTSLAVYNDGTGPALYAGGHFDVASGETANHIAKWNGVEWSTLAGPGSAGMDLLVNALTVFDDGTGPSLYAGGYFNTAGGAPVNRIARWDGLSWSALTAPGGTGVNGEVWALTVFDDGTGPALYAGGNFITAGGEVVNRVARWDGSSWSPLGSGVSSTVRAITVFDDGAGPALYAGGNFITAGGEVVNRIARWDGANWSPLTGPNGTGVSGVSGFSVLDLKVFDDGTGPALYAGGGFTVAGGESANGFARWDGCSWSTLIGPNGSQSNDRVDALAVFDDGSGPGLYAGGLFPTAGDESSNLIVRWDGSGWSPLAGATEVRLSNRVEALTVFDDGSGPSLYTGGRFTAAGSMTMNGIARWNGVSWSALTGPSGIGVNNRVHALTIFDDGSGPALYAGGMFTTAGGVTVDRIARWDGAQWFALTGPNATGVDGAIEALTVFEDGTGPALYAGGQFSIAGGVTVNHIARWDGTQWSSLTGPNATGVNGAVYALAVVDDGEGPVLYAAGNFITAGGETVNRIARWDGTTWSALTGSNGTGMSGPVYALAEYHDGTSPALYAGGWFTTAGGETVNNIAKWDGSDWSPLSGPNGTGVSHPVYTLSRFDDGSGPGLYAGGQFTTAGGRTVNHIAKWDGKVWSPLAGPSGTGVSSQVEALAVFDDGTGQALFAGGNFFTAGGIASFYMAKWTTCPADPSCNVADLAEPFGLLDLADIVAFATAFAAQNPAADLSEPFGVFDLDDIVAFITAFEAGCR
jgi:hypothetical protein